MSRISSYFTLIVSSTIMRNKFRVIGVMSGTSLDGLDIAYCIFEKKAQKWAFKIQETICETYPKEFRQKLAEIEKSSALDFVKLDTEFGSFIGKKVKLFMDKNRLKVDFVSSHGQTIFHQPQNGFTSQIGNGAAIAAACGITTICDFRRLDVALKGQGAPLVPIGDQYLFSEYEFCLNLGGFANVSFQNKGKRLAFDICPVNIVLNALSEQLGKAYDRNGTFASRGHVDKNLLAKLNSLKFYKMPFPKSLGKEWVLDELFPILHQSSISVHDKLATFCEHIAIQMGIIATFSGKKRGSKILCSGGGVYNHYLMQRIQTYSKYQLLIPATEIIEFKEALLFAFLGVLRITEQKNCLQSVTGAIEDNVGGCVYFR